MGKLLYTIKETRKRSDGIALLPGIQAGDLTSEEMQSTGHGSMLEFRMPNGKCRVAEVINYYVEMEDSLPDPKKLLALPIVLVIEAVDWASLIVSGTEIWLCEKL